jgi:hypothetical protein
MHNNNNSTVLTDWPTIARHEPLWRTLVNHSNAHPDYVKAVVASRPEVESPLLFFIADGDTLCIAVGRLEKAVISVDMGYLRLFKSTVLQVTIIHGGIMGGLTRATAQALLARVRLFLKERKAHRVLIAGVPKESLLWHEVKKSVPLLLRDFAPRFSPHWHTALPATWEEYHKKIDSKHRSLYRRNEKKIAEQAGGQVSVKIFTKETEIDQFCKDAESIAKTTYHRGIGAGFSDTAEMRRRLAVCAKNHWMRGYILYAGGQAITFWLGTHFNNTFLLDYTGYSAAYAKFSPGLVLFVKMIENLYSVGAINSIDFGEGDASYKQRFGDTSSPESDIIFYAAVPAMIAYSLVHTALTIMRKILETIIPKNLLLLIKKKWRGQAAQHGEAA